jgi:hypothetical protein
LALVEDENPGRNLAHLARIRFFEGDPRGKAVIILTGDGDFVDQILNFANETMERKDIG